MQSSNSQLSAKISPLVTVVVLCHNQADFVEEALESVKNQNYSDIQLIIVDDSSTDNSRSIITSWNLTNRLAEHVELIEKPMGMTKAFMQVANKIKGKYLIDLAADDILMPYRIHKQVAFLESESNNYCLCYSDSILINQNGKTVGTWYEDKMRLKRQSASQDLIVMLLSNNHICTPTVMYVVDHWHSVGGFNPNYAYEDLPVFLAFALKGYQFGFINEKLTKRRIVAGSATTRKFKLAKSSTSANQTLATTLALSENLITSLKNEEQKVALLNFTRYHLKLSVVLGYLNYALGFYKLIGQLGQPSIMDRLLFFLIRLRLPLYALLLLKPRRW